MQKVLRFLEANVEWFALSVAVIFLGATAFIYLLGQPVSEKLDGKVVTPTDIDDAIGKGPAEKLRQRMESTATAEPPKFPVADFAGAVTGGLSLEGEGHPSPLAEVFDWQPFDLGNKQEEVLSQALAVKQLPNLPGRQPLLVATGLDTLSMAPATPTTPVIGAAVPAVNDAAAPQAGAPSRDVALTVAVFTVPWAPLWEQWNKAFGPDKANGPPKLTGADIQILSVVTTRREKLPDGNWGPEVLVPCTISGLPPYPKEGDKLAQDAYLAAWSKQPTDVGNPLIPTPIAGAAWPKSPLDLLEQKAPPGQGGTVVPPGAVGALMPSNQFPADMAAPAGGSPGNGAPAPLQRLINTPVPKTPGSPTPAAAPVVVPPAPGTTTPIVHAANAGVPPAVPPVPPTKISPLTVGPKAPDLCIYVVDETARSGGTYQYRITYKLLNPLFGKAPIKAQNSNWVNQFDLGSPISDYSPEITVPTKTYLYCGKQPSTIKKTQFPFEVITWAAGQWHSDNFTVNWGDPIGGMDNGIDYSTGYSFADERSTNGSRFLITLMDNRDGSADVRDASKDATSDDHKLKLAWVEQSKLPAGANVNAASADNNPAPPPTPAPAPTNQPPPGRHGGFRGGAPRGGG